MHAKSIIQLRIIIALKLYEIDAGKDLDMSQAAIAIMILASTWLTVTECQLPCDSSLRQFEALSHLFTHCTCGPMESQTDPHCLCTRSNWTEWTALNVMSISTEICPSGKEILEERRQRVLTGFNISDCRDIIKRRRICEFISVHKLYIESIILGLQVHTTLVAWS